MRARSLTLSALAGLSVLSLGLTTSLTTATAQTPPSVVSNLDAQAADVRAVIRDLFKTSGRSFTIDPSVQGSVTISLRNVSLETALQNVTRQVGATYQVEGGVYNIVPLQAAVPQPAQGGGLGGGIGGGGFGGGQGGLGGGGIGGGQGGFGGGGQGGFGGGGAFQGAPLAGEPPVMTVDGDSIYVLRRGTLYKVDKKSLKLVGQIALGPVGPGGGRPGGGPGGGGGFGR